MQKENNREIDIFHDKRNIGDDSFEFLIRRKKGFDFSDDFEIPKNSYENILTPNSIPVTDYKVIEYEYCEYKISNSKVSIVGEFAGIQVVIENNGIKREVVKKTLEEIRNNIEIATNHAAQIIEV